MADVGDGGGFHFNGNGLREVVADFRQPYRAVDECVAADDQPTNGVEVQRFDAGFRRGNQFVISFETCRTAQVVGRIRSRTR